MVIEGMTTTGEQHGKDDVGHRITDLEVLPLDSLVSCSR
jgi:hypothetical protein